MRNSIIGKRKITLIITFIFKSIFSYIYKQHSTKIQTSTIKNVIHFMSKYN